MYGGYISIVRLVQLKLTISQFELGVQHKRKYNSQNLQTHSRNTRAVVTKDIRNGSLDYYFHMANYGGSIWNMDTAHT